MGSNKKWSFSITSDQIMYMLIGGIIALILTMFLSKESYKPVSPQLVHKRTEQVPADFGMGPGIGPGYANHTW